jgi:signal transduction histidine kinase
MKNRLVVFLERQPKFGLWMEAVVLAVGIGWIDRVTSYEVSLVLFYSLPILLMVWFANRMSAVIIAMLCTGIWWWADWASGHMYTRGWHEVWQTLFGLIYFLLFIVGATMAKARIALLEHSRRLEQEIIRISEREQRRIGQDLHDGLCQYYAAVGCAAGSLKHTLEKEGSLAAKSASELEELIMKGVWEARNVARGLAPVENDQWGLQFALEELASSTGKLLDIHCRFFCDRAVFVFDSTCATQLYRIAQEAINNASRHGKATVVDIRLSSTNEDVTMVIEDNGCGIPQPLPRNGGMGLSIMQYRARIIDGHLDIVPRPGGGTTISITFQQQAPNTTQPTHEALN